MPKELQVCAHPDSESWGDVEEAVKTANGLQTWFRFVLRPNKRLLSSNSEPIDFKALSELASKGARKTNGLIFGQGPFDNNVLVNEVLPHRVFVSCGIDKDLDAPPFRLYLLYQLASAALTLTSRISPEINKQMIHKPPAGCLWDWWTTAGERSMAMVSARICRRCRNALTDHAGVGEEDIASSQQILNYIRRTMMGEEPEISNRIFIAYGRGIDWKALVTMLETWNLQVEYFNRTPVANLLIAERWRQMLNSSRFAFAVLTPDDEMKDGTRRPRQNVIHEVGLCHAHLGLHNTTILRAKGTDSFSNAAGVNVIEFDQGRLDEIQDPIRLLLEERGILQQKTAKETGT